MKLNGLQADSDGNFAPRKAITEEYKIIDEERSRKRKERSEKKANINRPGSIIEPGCTLGLDRGRLTEVNVERLKCWSVADVEEKDIRGESALRVVG